MDKFKKYVTEMTEEWNEWHNGDHGYGITLEFSTSEENFLEKFEFLQQASGKVLEGEWFMGRCSTCADDNEDTPFHVDIRKLVDTEAVHKLERKVFQLEQRNRELSDHHRNIVVERDTLQSAIVDMEWLCSVSGERPEGLDSYREISLVLDESHKALKESE